MRMENQSNGSKNSKNSDGIRLTPQRTRKSYYVAVGQKQITYIIKKILVDNKISYVSNVEQY